MRMSYCVNISPSFAHCFLSPRHNPTVSALPFAGRSQRISLRLQTVTEDWTAVMCSLCQHTATVGEP